MNKLWRNALAIAGLAVATHHYRAQIPSVIAPRTNRRRLTIETLRWQTSCQLGAEKCLI